MVKINYVNDIYIVKLRYVFKNIENIKLVSFIFFELEP